MADREKVIWGLEQFIDDFKPFCGNRADWQKVYDALALLKEQEPMVLEYSEIEKHPLVWLEDNDKENVIPALFIQYNGWNAEFAVQAPDEDVDTIIRSPIVIADERIYGVTWRAWMTQPTNEQRKAVKWDET